MSLTTKEASIPIQSLPSLQFISCHLKVEVVRPPNYHYLTLLRHCIGSVCRLMATSLFFDCWFVSITMGDSVVTPVAIIHATCFSGFTLANKLTKSLTRKTTDCISLQLRWPIDNFTICNKSHSHFLPGFRRGIRFWRKIFYRAEPWKLFLFVLFTLYWSKC